MKDLVIIIENKDQQTCLSLITVEDQHIIEEITTYLNNGNIFKTSTQKDVYHTISNECAKKFFDCQLNVLIEYYRTKGEEIKIKLL